VIRRDGFRCRACGAGLRLLVHHRAMDSEERMLITLGSVARLVEK
jgi:hypothetical protein